METPVIGGIVSSSGQVMAGAGFALTRTGPGAYAIRFVEPCAEIPVILATATEPAHVVSAVATAAGAEVTITNLSGVRADGGFAFAAVTPASP
jgi:hypothetical protein